MFAFPRRSNSPFSRTVLPHIICKVVLVLGGSEIGTVKCSLLTNANSAKFLTVLQKWAPWVYNSCAAAIWESSYFLHPSLLGTSMEQDHRDVSQYHDINSCLLNKTHNIIQFQIQIQLHQWDLDILCKLFTSPLPYWSLSLVNFAYLTAFRHSEAGWKASGHCGTE